MTDFKKGRTDGPNDDDIFTAGINHTEFSNQGWLNRIEVHGFSQSQAEEMRDYVLTCLNQSLEDVEIEVIENLVNLGIAYANDAVASGLRSWHPQDQEKMRHLAGPQAKVATAALKKLKGETP